MDEGHISTRYAKAILQHASNRGVTERVYADALAILSAWDKPEEMAPAIDSSVQEMKDLLALVVRNKRTQLLGSILRSIVRLYRKDHKIKTAFLVSAAEDPAREAKIRGLLSQEGYENIEFRSEVREDLLGGFVLQIDDRRLDASLSRQLKTIRKELEEKNKRII